jgi:hypothetical protein
MLLRSAFAHLGNPYYFLSTVYSYQLTSIEVGKWTALVVPYLQLVVGFCLLTGWWLREAYLLALGLFSLFLGAQGWALRQGLEISCGCLGASESLRVGWLTLAIAGTAASACLLGWLLTALRERVAGNFTLRGTAPCVRVFGEAPSR